MTKIRVASLLFAGAIVAIGGSVAGAAVAMGSATQMTTLGALVPAPGPVALVVGGVVLFAMRKRSFERK